MDSSELFGLACVGDSMDGLLAWYDCFLCSARLPAVVDEAERSILALVPICQTISRTRERGR